MKTLLIAALILLAANKTMPGDYATCYTGDAWCFAVVEEESGQN